MNLTNVTINMSNEDIIFNDIMLRIVNFIKKKTKKIMWIKILKMLYI